VAPTSPGASSNPTGSGGGAVSGSKTGSGANPSQTGSSGALPSANLPMGSLVIVLGGFLAGAMMLF
jgi:hypothetical protein